MMASPRNESSSPISSLATSSPSPPPNMSNDSVEVLMDPAQMPEDPMDEDLMPAEVIQEVHGHHGIAALRVCMETGPEEVRKTTHLELTIDSSTWSDYLDDDLAILLNEFAPLSENLRHLTIVIRGNTYFTRCNYIKPVVTHQVVVETDEPKDGDEDDPALVKEEPNSDDEDQLNGAGNAKGRPAKKVKFARAAEINVAAPSTNDLGDKLKPRTLPFNNLDYHMSDKNFLVFLLKLHKPIPEITIKGPMEICLRREIIETLNPGWRNHPHCVAQMGRAEADRPRVAIAIEFETNMQYDMKRNGPAGDECKQDVDDFGYNSRMKLENVNRYGMGKNWIVPTGKAGRAVMGWKAVAGKTWKGPT